MERRVWRRLGAAAAAVARGVGGGRRGPVRAGPVAAPGATFSRASDFGQTFQVADSFFAALSVAGVALRPGPSRPGSRPTPAARPRSRAGGPPLPTPGRPSSRCSPRSSRGAPTLVRTSQAAHEEIHRGLGGDESEPSDPAGHPPGAVKEIARVRKEQLAELLALIDHAEKLSGWAGKKAAHLPTPLTGDDAPESPPFFRKKGPESDGVG